MNDKARMIRGYEVLLEFTPEPANPSGWTSHGYVIRNVGNKTYSGSIELMLNLGGLEDELGHEHSMPAGVISEIEQWALANGY
jgi:hypothetical protein